MKNLILALVGLFLLAACGAPAVTLEGTSWNLVEINGAPIVEGTAPTLVFDKESVGGNSSCNQFGGNYTLSGGKLTIGETFSTMMACMDAGVMEQESAYLQALSTVEGLTLAADRLVLLNGAGESVLVFKKQ